MNLVLESRTELWPLGVYFAAVIAIVSGMIALSYLLGERRQYQDKHWP